MHIFGCFSWLVFGVQLQGVVLFVSFLSPVEEECWIEVMLPSAWQGITSSPYDSVLECDASHSQTRHASKSPFRSWGSICTVRGMRGRAGTRCRCLRQVTTCATSAERLSKLRSEEYFASFLRRFSFQEPATSHAHEPSVSRGEYPQLVLVQPLPVKVCCVVCGHFELSAHNGRSAPSCLCIQTWRGVKAATFAAR